MPITINKIAELCGVSRGTVDRALHNKGNVRPELRDKIKRVAEEYGYQPNRAGLALSRASRPARIGIILHSVQTPFIQMLLEYCRKEAERLRAYSTEVIFRLASDVDPLHQAAMIDELVNTEKVDGIIIMPLHNDLITFKINELIEQRHMPIITVNTDLPSSRRLCYIGQDNITAGQTAAGLMGLVLEKRGRVLPFTGHFKGHFAYSQRMQGFLSEMEKQFPDIELLPVESCLDNGDRSEELTLTALRRYPDLSGIYVASYGYDGVCRALVRLGLAQKIHVITHDEVQSNLQFAQDHVIDFIIGQDAQMQATLPLQLMGDYILLKRQPEKENYFTDIRVLFHYNLGTLLNP
ncbi:MAG: LacI family DNA-binding transcriptional regulator [Clostridiaceae bacterium]|nr:LacI family DNA-binding transcriptional regulator [Clostridiaceae bacterium]